MLKHYELIKITDWVCPDCACPHVEHKQWVQTNTGTLMEPCEDDSEWCPNCNETIRQTELVNYRPNTTTPAGGDCPDCQDDRQNP